MWTDYITWQRGIKAADKVADQLTDFISGMWSWIIPMSLRGPLKMEEWGRRVIVKGIGCEKDVTIAGFEGWEEGNEPAYVAAFWSWTKKQNKTDCSLKSSERNTALPKYSF